METRELIEQQSKIIASLTRAIEVLSMENSEKGRDCKEFLTRLMDAEECVMRLKRDMEKMRELHRKEMQSMQHSAEQVGETTERNRILQIVKDTVPSLINVGVKVADEELDYTEACQISTSLVQGKITEGKSIEGDEDDYSEDEDEEDS